MPEISFDDVYNSKIDLKVKEIETLFVDSKDIRLKKLKDDYGDAWDKLRPNEQLGILLPYFNGPGTVKEGTNFHKNIVAYTNTGDPKHLPDALKELTDNSNKNKIAGLQKRRIIEAIVLDSRKCPLYVVGTAHQFPKELKVVYAEKLAYQGRCLFLIPKNLMSFWSGALGWIVK